MSLACHFFHTGTVTQIVPGL